MAGRPSRHRTSEAQRRTEMLMIILPALKACRLTLVLYIYVVLPRFDHSALRLQKRMNNIMRTSSCLFFFFFFFSIEGRG